MSKCDTVVIGIDPETGDTCQMIDTECMAAPEGVTVHTADDGSTYWCRGLAEELRAAAYEVPRANHPLRLLLHRAAEAVSSRRPGPRMGERNGGPALPRPHSEQVDGSRDWAQEGMSLRDYFAAHALIGFLSAPADSVSQDVGPNARANPAKAAAWAYEQADAMLKARDPGTNGDRQ